MGTIATVTIGADNFSVYALTASAVADANSFWNGRIGADATAWAAATTDNKGRVLVMASDWIDRALGELFSGEKTVDGQPRAFPRDGASYCGTTVPDGTTPDALAFATFWLAGQLLLNATLASGTGSGSNVKQAVAGSASVTFFQPTIGSAQDTRLPIVAMDYLKCLLSGAGSSAAVGFASGTDCSSAFSPCDFRRSDGYP